MLVSVEDGSEVSLRMEETIRRAYFKGPVTVEISKETVERR
jgi:hypothetical protein